jgi:membrane associated rhomboid family serine protease
MGALAFRIAVVGAWIGGLLALTTWSATTPAVVCALILTLATGLLVGRWWLLLLPVAVAAAIAIGLLVDGRDPGEWWDASPGTYAVGVAMAAALVAALLGFGVAVRKSVAAMRQRSGRRQGQRSPGTTSPFS